MAEYYRYIEQNRSTEGETWNAFIKVPETEDEQKRFDALQAIIELADGNEDEEDSYYFAHSETGIITYSEEKVQLFLEENKFSETGYMEEYFTGTIKEEVVDIHSNIDKDIDWWLAQDKLYKMQLIQKD